MSVVSKPARGIWSAAAAGTALKRRATVQVRSLARSKTKAAIKPLVFDKVLGMGSTDPLSGFASVTSNLVVSFYFAKRSFENVARIMRR